MALSGLQLGKSQPSANIPHVRLRINLACDVLENKLSAGEAADLFIVT
jgi:hypothetical protein